MEQSVIKRLLAQSCRPARRSPETEELYGHYWAEERAFFERLSADAPALAQSYDALQRLYCDWAYEAGADRFGSFAAVTAALVLCFLLWGGEQLYTYIRSRKHG